MQQPAPFRLGPLTTTCLIRAGDGVAAIPERNVRSGVVPGEPFPANLPPRLAAARERVRHIHESGACDRHWNSPTFRLDTFSAIRNADEELVLDFGFSPSDYFTSLAAQGIDCAGSPDTTPAGDAEPGAGLLPGVTFGVNVAAVTGDNRVLFSRRSTQVAVGAGLWNSSANEGLSRALDVADDGAVDLFAAARRALAEELTVFDHDIARLDLLSVAVDMQRRQWAAMFCAQLTCTEDALRQRWTRGMHDPWEHTEFVFTRAEPEDVLGFLLDPARRESWAACAPTLFYHTLVRLVALRDRDRHARSVVEAALDQALVSVAL